MKIENRYLSDEELALLILEVEQNELVSAPPDFSYEILERLDTQIIEEQNLESQRAAVRIRKRRNKNREFVQYCIRVIGSAAAAIVLLFAFSNVEIIQKQNIPTRQELVGKTISREEALDETKLMTKFMNGLNERIGGFSNETEKEK